MQDKVRQAPLLPGCYIYRNKQGKILYIGKAKVLRNRVKSYFSNYNRVEEKIRQMIDQAQSIEFYLTDSEIEALILESNLIKKYKPKYNSMQVDDKSYAYVKFDKLRADSEPQVIPGVNVVRERLDKDADYYGPYPDSRVVKRLLRRLRRIFPYCESNVKVIIPPRGDQMIKAVKPTPCFHYQIGQCCGICAGKVTRGEYVENLNSIKKFFKGEKTQLVTEIEQRMLKAAKAQEFEQAARLRNMLKDIKYVGSNLRLGQEIDEVAIIKAKQEKKALALEDLTKALGISLPVLGKFRIECYDISNIQGKFAVGSMVVSIGGEPRPDMYRRFKIRMENEPNDFAMMQEVLTRRFLQYLDSQDALSGLPSELRNRAKNWKPDESFSQMPDLIIIDGGKGQLSSAFEIMQNFGLDKHIPVVGLAKREEEVFKVNIQTVESHGYQLRDANSYGGMLLNDPGAEGPFTKVRLPRRGEALYLVQRIRDEAHRFAITYHRKLRSKAIGNFDK